MTKGRAIYLKCLDCAAGDRKEVLFCTLFDCSLWEYRCGCHVSSRRYRDRIERGFQTFTRIVAELHSQGLDCRNFLRNDELASVSVGNRGKTTCGTGKGPGQGEVVFGSFKERREKN